MRIAKPFLGAVISAASMSLAATLNGCATSASSASKQQTDAGNSNLPKAECLVCKYNADLACVGLRVDESTPRFAYQGVTYYFCSPQCQAAFAKDPAKYLRP